MGKSRRDFSPHSTFLFSFRLVPIALENFECPRDIQASMFLLLCLLNVFEVSFKVKQLLKIPPRAVPRGWIVMSSRVCGAAWEST